MNKTAKILNRELDSFTAFWAVARPTPMLQKEGQPLSAAYKQLNRYGHKPLAERINDYGHRHSAT